MMVSLPTPLGPEMMISIAPAAPDGLVGMSFPSDVPDSSPDDRAQTIKYGFESRWQWRGGTDELAARW